MPSPIPHPKGLPVLGNLFDLDAKNPWGSFNRLAAQHRPIFKVSILGHDIVFVTSAALLEEICDETRFRKCVTGPIVEIRAAVHDSLFTAYHHEGEIWGIAHRIMAPLVSPAAIESVFADIRETTAGLIAKWTATSGSGSGGKQRVNVTNDLDRNNHEANMAAFFHERVSIMEGTEPPVIAAMQRATEESLKRTSRPSFLTWLLGHQRKYDRDIKTMRDYGAAIVAKRRAAEQENPESQPKDMLHALLHGTDPETGKSLSDSQVLDEIINIFIGSATAPNLLAFALYYLSLNPEVVVKAREELDAVVGATGEFTHAHLAQIPYTEAVLRETLRLSAAAPGFNIEPIPSEGNEPVLLAGGEYQVSRKQPLIALLTHVNRDPAVFEDPEAFKPERLVGEKYDALPAGVKKGFGSGKRQCFGTRYAWEWSLLVLATLIKEVDFELADKGYKVDNGGVNYNGAFSTRPLGFFLLVGGRQRQE
ncbi:putative cytochrome P450 [Aspergillus lucknowensis]|uniref:Cytochrome P450 n=1 Tax=Aspergillus lucknowensis TaxID=176173 RepID=A0ABR4LFX3_9EURO